MSPKTKYQVGSGLLILGVALLIVQLLGMTGITRKFVPTRELSLVTLVLVVAAGAMRRHARKEMKAVPPTP